MKRVYLLGSQAAVLIVMLVVASAGAGAQTPRPQVVRQLTLRQRSPTHTSTTRGAGHSTTTAASAGGVLQSFQGIYDPGLTPSDSNGAVSSTRQVELVNSMVGIWNRASTPSLLSQTTLQTLTHAPDTLIFDPNVIWDPQTQRFYYSALDDTSNLLFVGFSKTASPSGPSDFCHYSLSQTDHLDMSLLGDSKSFILIGTYHYTNGPEVVWYDKPQSGTTCPASLTTGSHLTPVSGAGHYPPDPARQVDANATGYVLFATGASASKFGLIPVTRSSTGTPVFGAEKDVTVSAYSAAPAAPQEGATQLIGVMDPRPTEATSAVDPGQGGKTAIWTTQVVAGRAGSEVRWYEINPATAKLFQSGVVSDPKLWVYNGGIAPDRLVNGSTHKFGNAMALTVDTSSSTTHVTIRYVTKIDGQAQSALTVVEQSSAAYQSFDCQASESICRWGDYPGAAPDPSASSTATHGIVWMANMWNVANSNPIGGTAWRTWIFRARP
jgi:hypothetical protein